VPLYHKIRISYEDIIQVVMDFHKFLSTAAPLNQIVSGPEFEWDIHLTTVNELKTDLLATTQLDTQTKVTCVTESMPRFVWRAIGHSGDQRSLELIFDATDIHTSNGIHNVICYDAVLRAALPLIASDPKVDAIPELPTGARRVLAWFRKQIS